ncbi:hypothetical protein AVEN_60286-1 [Araneus ventricosus]|uniref:Uncharacterized protein n=1 Tax=Araneus ventricosus TaxID=182803 RepID=A0A4Y2CZW6_ARAVE|nr:hypothetical protein AVEN_60286-1 [Araneus ventricosus]
MIVGICHNSDKKYCMWPFSPRIFRDEGDAPNEILRPSLHAPNGSQIINFHVGMGFLIPDPHATFFRHPGPKPEVKKKRYYALYCILPFLMQNPLCLPTSSQSSKTPLWRLKTPKLCPKLCVVSWLTLSITTTTLGPRFL